MAIKERPTFTTEQKEAWKSAKRLLKSLAGTKRFADKIRYRALHIAMSELRGKYKDNQGPIEIESKNPDKAQQRKNVDAYHSLRQRIDVWKAYFDNPGLKKLFIITDNELSDSQKAVQSAHCATQFQKEHPDAPWTNGTLVLLCPDPNYKHWDHPEESRLEVFFARNAGRYNYVTQWEEPDMDNKLTSVAILDDFAEAGKINGLKML